MSDQREKIASIIRINFKIDDWELCMATAGDVLSLFKVEGFVKVSRCFCPVCTKQVEAIDESLQRVIHRCNGKGEIRIPLQWEDVNWKALLDYAMGFSLRQFLTTKSGERIEREK